MTTDLAFTAHSKKLLILPHRYPHWPKLKEELETLARAEKPLKSVEAVYSIIRLSQKGGLKLKALDCFTRFLEALEAGKIGKSDSAVEPKEEKIPESKDEKELEEEKKEKKEEK